MLQPLCGPRPTLPRWGRCHSANIAAACSHHGGVAEFLRLRLIGHSVRSYPATETSPSTASSSRAPSNTLRHRSQLQRRTGESVGVASFSQQGLERRLAWSGWRARVRISYSYTTSLSGPPRTPRAAFDTSWSWAERRKYFYYAQSRQPATINEDRRAKSSAFDASYAGLSRISFSSVIQGVNISAMSIVTCRAAE